MTSEKHGGRIFFHIRALVLPTGCCAVRAPAHYAVDASVTDDSMVFPRPYSAQTSRQLVRATTITMHRGILTVCAILGVALCVVSPAAAWEDALRGGESAGDAAGDCCLLACCKMTGADPEYQCQQAANECMTGVKYTGGARCGPGNNGHICAAPSGGSGSGSSSSGGGTSCSSGCIINGVCQDSAEKCVQAIGTVVRYILYIGGGLVLLCILGCVFMCFCRPKPRTTYVQMPPGAAPPAGTYMPPGQY